MQNGNGNMVFNVHRKHCRLLGKGGGGGNCGAREVGRGEGEEMNSSSKRSDP